MSDAVINIVKTADFQVLLPADETPVTGLVNGDFTKYLYDETGAEIQGIGVGLITVTVTELSEGWYRASWTMDAVGEWTISILYDGIYYKGGFTVRDTDINATANPVVDMEIIVPPLVTISDAGTGNEYYTFTIVLTTSRGSIVTAAEITDVGTMTIYRKPKGISTSWVSKGSVAMVGTRDGSIHASLTFTTAGGYAPGDDLRFLFEGQQVTIGGVLYELINTGLGFFHFSHIQEYDLTLEANATTNTNSIIAEVDANEAKIDLLQVDLKRILGLSQENTIIDTIVYNGDDSATSARVRIFPTKADTEAETNVLSTYTLTNTYDGSGNLTKYEMVLE